MAFSPIENYGLIEDTFVRRYEVERYGVNAAGESDQVSALAGGTTEKRQTIGKGLTTMAGLQERLDEFKRSFESGAPPYNAPREAIEKMHRATAELEASGIEDRALKVGDRAPSFTLFNQDHVEVSSAELLRVGPLVVSFFRGHW